MIIKEDVNQKYNEYLENHISGVKKSFNWMIHNIPRVFDYHDLSTIQKLIDSHDQSKYSKEEYIPYCQYFYGENRTKAVENNFDAAWLHHQHANPHHWQHWVLREDDGDLKLIKIPFEYIIEMICDWWSFSWNKNNLYEIFDWYDENKSKMLLHDLTRTLVEEILLTIRQALDNA